MSDYTNGKIYKIIGSGLTYYGSTIQSLKARMRQHENIKSVCSSKQIIDNGEYEVVLVENYPCNCKKELLMRERYYVENNECVNKNKPVILDDEWPAYQQKFYQENINYFKEYRQKNRDRILDYNKKRYQEKKEYHKQYKDEHYEEIQHYKAQYRKNNKEKISLHKKKYHQENIEKIREYKKKYREENKEKLSIKAKNYYQMKKYKAQFEKVLQELLLYFR